MADYLTHDLLGSEVIQSSRGAVHARLTEYPEAFRWGCQGPDPFFYRRLWEGGGPYHPLANRMHEEDTAGLFYAMARYAMEQSGWEREVCTAYLDGFLCHYSLDSEIHPYVYFLQGKGESRNPGVTCGTVHGQVETDIDIALYSPRGGRHISDFHPGDEHHLPALQKEAIAAMLCTVIRQVYDVELPQTEAEAAFGDTLFIEDFLYRRGRNLAHLAFAAGLLKPAWSDFVSHAKVAEPQWDALNLRRRGWRNPDEPEVLRKESVPEILEIAREKTLSLIGQYEDMFADGTVRRIDYPVTFGNGSGKAADPA